MREYTDKVRILKESSADRASTRSTSFGRNEYARDNVNVAQGPRVGNTGAHAAKRDNFLDEKEARYEISDHITRAFGARAAELQVNPGEHEVPESGGISSNTQVQRFAARKNKYKD
jgi:hypothetical protein